MLVVLKRHCAAVEGLPRQGTPEPIAAEARAVWEEALEVGPRCGSRNAQVTALAPTTTVSRLLGCESFGVEPVPALIANDGRSCDAVAAGLAALGYSETQREALLSHLATTGSLAGAAASTRAPRGVRLRAAGRPASASGEGVGPGADGGRGAAVRLRRGLEHAGAAGAGEPRGSPSSSWWGGASG
jgi:ribonucleoside-diphosphate reductase alpha chain